MDVLRINFLRVLFHLAALFCAVSSCQAKEGLADYNEMELSGKLKEPNEKFTLRVRCLPSNRKVNVASIHGADGEQPKCLTDLLLLTVNGNRIEIHRDAYQDLGAIHIPLGISVSRRQKNFVINVSGGDGASSFRARIFTDNQRALYREIDELDKSGELKTSHQELK